MELGENGNQRKWTSAKREVGESGNSKVDSEKVEFDKI